MWVWEKMYIKTVNILRMTRTNGTSFIDSTRRKMERARFFFLPSSDILLLLLTETIIPGRGVFEPSCNWTRSRFVTNRSEMPSSSLRALVQRTFVSDYYAAVSRLSWHEPEGWISTPGLAGHPRYQIQGQPLTLWGGWEIDDGPCSRGLGWIDEVNRLLFRRACRSDLSGQTFRRALDQREELSNCLLSASSTWCECFVRCWLYYGEYQWENMPR